METTFAVGTQLNAHHDFRGKRYHAKFQIIGETPKRYKIKVIKEITNGNNPDEKIEVEETKTVSFDTLLKLQHEFCEFQHHVVIEKIKC